MNNPPGRASRPRPYSRRRTSGTSSPSGFLLCPVILVWSLSTEVAGLQAATDPDRAARLNADAERTAQSITSGSSKASTLASIAGALAATDPDRAERTAQSITVDYWKARALAGLAGALAATDPDRAERT